MDPFLSGAFLALQTAFAAIQINYCTPSRDFAMEQIRVMDANHVEVHQTCEAGPRFGIIEVVSSGGTLARLPRAVRKVSTQHEPYDGRGHYRDVDHWEECEL